MSGLFADGKAPDALRTIGELSAALGIRQHVLRYWEEQFPMLQPLKRSGGRRYYRPEDVALVETIDRLVNQQRYTLKGARMAIEAGATVPASPIAPAAAPPFAGGSIAAELRAVRDRLAEALAAA